MNKLDIQTDKYHLEAHSKRHKKCRKPILKTDIEAHPLTQMNDGGSCI